MNAVLIKRFILRTLAAWDMPVPEPQLTCACHDNLVPRPTKAEVDDAIREMDSDGLIQGRRDALDKSLLTWSLTDKGAHNAR